MSHASHPERPLVVSTVELQELRVFLMVAEELQYRRAADRLALTPSRVSQIIRMLETRVGGRLFERTSRRVDLSPTGDQLRRELAPVLERLDAVLERAHESARGVAGVLRIGTYSPVVLGPRWIEIVEAFALRHPNCQVSFVDTGLDRNYLGWLLSCDVDALAMRLPLTHPGIVIGPVLSREPRVLAVSVRDPLSRRESIDYDELADRFVTDLPTLPREMMDSFIPPTTRDGRTLARVENRTIDEAMMRVAVGAQVHPTVPSWLAFHGQPGIVAVPIRDLPPTETALVWLTAKTSAKLAALADVADDVLASAPTGR